MSYPEFKISPHLLELNKSRRAQLVFWLVVLVFVSAIVFQTRFLYQETKRAAQAISASSQQALAHVEKASQALSSNLQFDQAKEELENADQSFSGLEKSLEKSALYQITRLLPYGRDAWQLRKGARFALKAGQDLTEVVKILANPVEFGIEPLFLSSDSVSLNEDTLALPEEFSRINFLVTVGRLDENIKKASRKLIQANQELSGVNDRILPAGFRENFSRIKNGLKGLEASLNNLAELTGHLNEVFGSEGLRRYLILFQNNNEIRATGGFIGSFALVDINRGQIKRIEMPADGSYALQKELRLSVASPRPLWPLKPQWQFHDANWFADWPSSAAKLAWFYENSGGVTVDGAIAITADLIADLMEIIGPIELPEYEKIIDGASFIEEIQKHVEIEARMKEEAPKQILADLAPKILEKILSFQEEKNRENLIGFLQFLNKGLLEKKLLIWLKNSDLQEWLEKENWAGQIRQTSKDYLYVVVSNSNGAKTEGVIDQNIFHQVEIDSDSLIGQVIVERKHQGKPGQLFTGKESIDWLRFYLPAGSIFLEAEGFEKILAESCMKASIGSLTEDEDLTKIEKEEKLYYNLGIRQTEEFGKVCFGGFVRTKPGQTSQVRVKYQLPFLVKNKDVFSYSLLVQKQPGMRPGTFGSQLIFKDGSRKIRWHYPEDDSLMINDNLIEFKTELDQDKYWAVVLD